MSFIREKPNIFVSKMENKQEKLHPRLEAKLKELQQRGILQNVKAYVPPQDTTSKKP